jgi:SP family xylose:H+ symportor-like MFS transporter
MKANNVNKPLVYGIALVATLGGFLFGYDTAVISGAISSLESFFIVPYHFSDTVAHTLLGIMVSGALLGCVIGSALGGYFSRRFGRKRSLLLAAMLFLCSGIGSAIPEIGFALPGAGNHTFLPQFILYRLIGGMGVGLASVLSPMYIAEIAPASMRGRLVSWNQMAIVIGILVVYFVNYLIERQGDVAWNEQTGWRLMFASSAIPAFLFLACLLFIPESPRWLVMQGKEEKAEKIMKKFHTGVVIREEIASIQASVEKVVVKGLKLGWRIWVAGLLLSAFQQLVGIQVMLYYAPEIFKNMGQNTDSAMLQTVLVGAINVVFTLVAIYTVDKYGRKPLLMLGSILMAIFMCVLAISFYTHNLGGIALICVLGFVASFSFSWGPITWVLLSEMFPNAVRSRLMSVAVAVQWVTNYLVSSTFPLLDKNEWLVNTFNHAFSFGLFGLMAALSCVFAWKFIPETKGKTLEEMEEIWKTKN